MKCPLRGTDCREDCAWYSPKLAIDDQSWDDNRCAVMLEYQNTRRLARALEALTIVVQAGIK